ncbi:kinase-like domain-containing protein [Podospora didyma]|uniref:Kinase-like domain-containing protein n=1 Tax=Podospora didyma TaxID=330526 RepID=A0AAE0N6U1_9PEZI|nr:kinase-like domain-containing protein [Podospora didyma]
MVARAQATEDEGGSAPVQCLAVSQRQENISCEITSPIHCKLFYDAREDSVQIENMTRSSLRIEPLAEQLHRNQDEETSGDDDAPAADATPIVIAAYRAITTPSGAWKFSSADGELSFQIIVFLRRHSLALVRLDPLSSVVGSKRTLPGLDSSIGTAASPVGQEVQSGHSEIIWNLKSLCDLPQGNKTLSADVFQAKHSSYPDRAVVVKTFRGHQDAMTRGTSWKREYDIHCVLQLDVIVELFSGDARVEALFLQHVDARDLTNEEWFDRQGSGLFRGTRDDARRVLVDMSRALCLRRKKVLHNDIKPGNILYGRKTGAVLVDFGLATVDGSKVSTGGTPWYVAPEHLDLHERKAPADVWAVGVMLIFLLKHIPLPESCPQSKGWTIKDVGKRKDTGRCKLASTARTDMEKWVEMVDGVRNKLKREQDSLSGAVVRMLRMDGVYRITAEKLVGLVETGDFKGNSAREEGDGHVGIGRLAAANDGTNA